MIRVYIAGRLPDGRFVAVGEHDLKLLHCLFLLILHVSLANQLCDGSTMIWVHKADRSPDGRFAAVGEHDSWLLFCLFLLILHTDLALCSCM